MVPLRRVVVAVIAILLVGGGFVWRAHVQAVEARMLADRAELARKDEEARRRALEAELARQAEAIAAAQAEAANAKSDAEREAAKAKLAAAQAAAHGSTRWSPSGSAKCAPGDPLCDPFTPPTPPASASAEKKQIKGIIAPQ